MSSVKPVSSKKNQVFILFGVLVQWIQKLRLRQLKVLVFFVILKRKLEIRNHAWIYKDSTGSINTPDKLLLVISKTNNVDPHKFHMK